jgi:hypothetical protein
VIYVILSGLLLRSRFKEQFYYRPQWKYMGIRVLAFIIWWLCTWAVPPLWHPVWWLGLSLLAAILFAELALIGVSESQEEVNGYFSIISFFGLSGTTVAIAALLQPFLNANESLGGVWFLIYIFILFGSLLGAQLFIQAFLTLLIGLFLFRDRSSSVLYRLRLNLGHAVYIMIILSAVALILTSNFVLQLWKTPFALFVVVGGWGIATNLATNLPLRVRTMFFAPDIYLQIVCATVTLYFLLREYVWLSLPPSALPEASSYAVFIGILLINWYIFMNQLAGRIRYNSTIDRVQTLTERLEPVAEQINRVRTEQRRSELFSKYGEIRQGLDSAVTNVRNLSFGPGTISPGIETAIRSLDSDTALELRRQDADDVVELITENLGMRNSLSALLEEFGLELSSELLENSQLEEQLTNAQQDLANDNLDAVLSEAEYIKEWNARLKEYSEAAKSIQDAEGSIERFEEKKEESEVLVSIADALELEHSTVDTQISEYQEALVAYSQSSSPVFKVKAELAKALDSSRQGLDNVIEDIRGRVLGDSYEWRSQEEGVYVYVPKTLQQNETRQVVVVVGSEYPEEEVSIEFECGLVHISNQSFYLKIPTSGHRTYRYALWSGAGGRGSVQVAIDDEQSAPLSVNVPPAVTQVLQEASISVAILIPLITIMIYLIFQVQIETAAALSAGVASIITVAFLMLRYLRSR